MDDLISRSALTDAIVDLLVFEWGYEGIEESVKQIFSEIPAVDAVEVVRCKDCKWYLPGTAFPDEMFCMRAVAKFAPDDFCSHGERRGDDATD